MVKSGQFEKVPISRVALQPSSYSDFSLKYISEQKKGVAIELSHTKNQRIRQKDQFSDYQGDSVLESDDRLGFST